MNKMYNAEKLPKNCLIAAISTFFVLAVVFLLSAQVYAYDEITPYSINLFSKDTTDTTGSGPGIYLQIYNSPDLLSATGEVMSDAQSQGIQVKGVSIQLQTRDDNTGWVSSDPGKYGIINPSDKYFTVKLLDPGKIDFEKNTYYVKIRYCWLTSDGEYYGEWSDTCAMGKNSSDVKVPLKIDTIPSVSDPAIAPNSNEEPVFSGTLEAASGEITKLTRNPNGTITLNIMASSNGKSYRNIGFYDMNDILSASTGSKISAFLASEDTGVYEPGKIKIRLRYEWYRGDVMFYGFKQAAAVSPWSEEYVFEVDPWSKAASWAEEELQDAYNMNLFPYNLVGKDMNGNITRAEFAAVAVKTYEAITNKKVSLPQGFSNPFRDTTNSEILKAYSLGIVNGIYNDTFAPDTYLTREQAATMLTRVYKKIHLNGWTLASDANFTLDYNRNISRFSDDYAIYPYAKDSVYFMSSNGIIKGMGDNLFSPKSTAQRQQALLIAIRMLNEL